MSQSGALLMALSTSRMSMYLHRRPAGLLGLVGNRSKVPPAMSSDPCRIISGGYPPLPAGVSS